MLFNSIDFLFYFFLIYSLYRIIKPVHRVIFILLVSLIFYGWTNFSFIFILILNGLVDYFLAILIVKHRKYAKYLLTLSVVTNVLFLVFFKYKLKYFTDLFFFVPIGISFYTFQSMSYTIDIYKKKTPLCLNIFNYLAYLSFFPQLIAGPIERSIVLISQFSDIKNKEIKISIKYIQLIILGFFKKMVISDNLISAVEGAFFGGHIVDNSLFWWIISGICIIHVYCDFSGYCDIAQGIAGIFGIELSLNFNNPLLSTTFSEFWKRWHISLSSWIRDYVYIPLKGDRNIAVVHVLLIAFVFALVGLWHGARISFIIFGLTFAFFYLIEFYIIKKILKRIKLVGYFYVMLGLSLAMISFWSKSFSQYRAIIETMFSLSGKEFFQFTSLNYFSLSMFLILYFYNFIVYKYQIKISDFNIVKNYFFSIVLIVFIIFFRGEGRTFVYFQF